MARLTVAALVLALLPSCTTEPGSSPTGNGKPTVYTTFYPTTYFAQRIGGDHIQVICPVPADADPIFWKPDAASIEAYQKADLIVVNGAKFEKWVDQVSLPAAKVVDTAAPLKKGFITYKKEVTHSHGPEGEHSHRGIDGHTWVDPILARLQADEIKKALIERFPDHTADFEKNYAALAADLNALDAAFKAATKGKKPWILASHPAYNYIARRYEWQMENFDLDPGEMPSEASLNEIAAAMKTKPARFMFWEGTPTPAIVERLSALGIESVTFSPCELLSDEEIQAGQDYLTVMKANLEAIRPAFE